MTNIDGLVCTWDFKDRLVAVENASMRAQYSYDYTDRRITKKVFWKNGELPPSTAAVPKTESRLPQPQPSATARLGKDAGQV